MTGPSASDGDLEVIDLRAELRDRRALTWRQRLGGPDRYGVLLLLIIATIVMSVVLREDRWERLVAISLAGVMLVFALRTSEASVLRQVSAIAVVATFMIAAGVAAVRGSVSTEVRAGIAALVTLLLIAVLLAIVRRLATHLTVSWGTILGALCIYLLFALVFAAAYSVAGRLQRGVLFAQQDDFTTADTIYFSLTTLTTVGFGDLTMRSDVTRVMSAIEAVLGQIYLIAAVGLLVGNLGRRRHARARR